jgi:hypothetical protein
MTLLHFQQDSEKISESEYAITIQGWDDIRDSYIDLDTFRVKFDSNRTWEVRECIVTVEYRVIWQVIDS